LKGIKMKSRRETWIKPEVEFVDLCTEVTLYLYNRHISSARARSHPRLGRRRGVPAVELPLRDV